MRATLVVASAPAARSIARTLASMPSAATADRPSALL
jgi:hypothetical protein